MGAIDFILCILPAVCLLLLIDGGKKVKEDRKRKALVCSCPYPREGTDITYMTWDFDSGSFTDFILTRCNRCGGFYGFPQGNFDLALTEDKERFIAFLETFNKATEGGKR